MTDFIRRLDAELVRVGIWGRAANRLKQELRDHYLTDKARLLAQGDSEPEASERALAHLGDPVELAQKARAESYGYDRNLKSQMFIRVMPLAAGIGAFLTAMGTIWAVFKLIDVHHFHLKVSIWSSWMEVFPLFAGIVVAWHLIPWLAIYLWILRASYSPMYGWSGLLVLSGYATLSCYLCTTLILFTGDGVNLYFHPAISNALHLALVIFLLVTPWRVRAQKLSRAKAA